MLNAARKDPRGKTLEEAFFFRMDQALVEQLKQKLDLQEKLTLMEQATGIRNRHQLLRLIDAGFDVPTITAFVWAPLVLVAWSDGKLDRAEKLAILDVMEKKGIARETASMMMEHEWFRQQPNEDLWRAWEEFVAKTLSNQQRQVQNEIADEIVALCYVVAQASGGMLGVGAISAKESETIDRVMHTLGSLAPI